MAYREPAPQTPPDIRAAPEPDPEQARRKRNRNIALTGAVIIAVILLIVLLRHHAASQAQKGAADAAATRNRAVPVAVAAVQIRDVPVFLDGLGNVNALKTRSPRCSADCRSHSAPASARRGNGNGRRKRIPSAHDPEFQISNFK